MFLKIGGYTINTDKILYAKVQTDGMTAIHLADQVSIQINKDEVERLWKHLNRQELAPRPASE